MKVRIYGQPEKWMPEDYKSAIRRMIDHTLSGWLSYRRMKNLEIKVCLNRKFDLGGEVAPDWMARDYKPNHFKMTLNPSLVESNEAWLTMVGHEAIHIAQYATGRLRNGARGVYWEGKIWDYPEPRHLGSSEYWETPWEIESYGLERAMLWSFINVQNAIKSLLETGECDFD